MLGCMIESGLGVAAGAQVASLFDHVDLDGNLLLAEDPWPGVELVDGVQLPADAARDSVSAKRYLILAEGRSGDPHYGKTARGVAPLRARSDVVAILDSTRAGETHGRDPDRRHRRTTRSRFEPTTALVGVATQGGRFPPAWRELLEAAASRTASTSRTACTSSSADDPELVELARAPRRRAARPAQAAAPTSNVPTGENLELPAQIVADRRLGLRDREDDGRARARPRGARGAACESVFVPTGQTGIAIAGWGIAVDAVVSDFLAGAAERLVVEGAPRVAASCSSSRARARSSIRRTPASRSG